MKTDRSEGYYQGAGHLGEVYCRDEGYCSQRYHTRRYRALYRGLGVLALLEEARGLSREKRSQSASTPARIHRKRERWSRFAPRRSRMSRGNSTRYSG